MGEEGCVFVWNGIGWTQSNPNACALGTHCEQPAGNGNFLGDTRVTNCVQ